MAGTIRRNKFGAEDDAKKVCFFKDGDTNFSGINVSITKNKYRNFESLLDDLSYKVPLPFGVRSIQTPSGAHFVHNLKEIKDGKNYVCSTFHKKPIHKLDYVGISNRRPWDISKPKIRDKRQVAVQTNTFPNQSDQLYRGREIKPKSITVVAKEDSRNRAKIVLSKKTALTYNSVLQTISNILQLNSGAVKDLYTVEGRKVGGLSDLISGPDVFVAVGRTGGGHVNTKDVPKSLLAQRKRLQNETVRQRSPASPAKSPRKKHSKNAQSVYLQSSESKNGTKKKTKHKKKNSKVSDEPWIITIQTGTEDNAGTDGEVTIQIYGMDGKSPEHTLQNSSTRQFEKGSTDEFEIKLESLGEIFKIRLSLDNVKEETAWHLQNVLMTSVDSNQEIAFPCDAWFSTDETSGTLVREFPAVKNGKEMFSVITYEISIFTGDVLAAGTDSKVYIIIFGEKGDTGKRLLNPTEDNEFPFERGNMDVFEIEAVSLGSLTQLMIGQDNSGETPGWFLDKVMVTEKGLHTAYTFPCRKWLDEEEDDGAVERILLPSILSDSTATKEELWEAFGWKVNTASQVVITSVTTGQSLRINKKKEQIKADGNEKKQAIFTVSEGDDLDVRIFTAVKQGARHLTLDEEKIFTSTGKSGLLSEFYVHWLPNGHFVLESVVHSGQFLVVGKDGTLTTGPREAGAARELKIHVKGTLRDKGHVRIRAPINGDTVIAKDELLYGDGHRLDEEAEFSILKIDDKIRAFQNVTTKKFINISGEDIQCEGTDEQDQSCQFLVHRCKNEGFIQLESVKMPGVYLGVTEHGRVKHAVDAGDDMTKLSLEVISYGLAKEREEESASESSDEEMQDPNVDADDSDADLAEDNTSDVKSEVSNHSHVSTKDSPASSISNEAKQTSSQPSSRQGSSIRSVLRQSPSNSATGSFHTPTPPSVPRDSSTPRRTPRIRTSVSSRSGSAASVLSAASSVSLPESLALQQRPSSRDSRDENNNSIENDNTEQKENNTQDFNGNYLDSFQDDNMEQRSVMSEGYEPDDKETENQETGLDSERDKERKESFATQQDTGTGEENHDSHQNDENTYNDNDFEDEDEDEEEEEEEEDYDEFNKDGLVSDVEDDNKSTKGNIEDKVVDVNSFEEGYTKESDTEQDEHREEMDGNEAPIEEEEEDVHSQTAANNEENDVGNDSSAIDESAVVTDKNDDNGLAYDEDIQEEGAANAVSALSENDENNAVSALSENDEDNAVSALSENDENNAVSALSENDENNAVSALSENDEDNADSNPLNDTLQDVSDEKSETEPLQKDELLNLNDNNLDEIEGEEGATNPGEGERDAETEILEDDKDDTKVEHATKENESEDDSKELEESNRNQIDDELGERQDNVPIDSETKNDIANAETRETGDVDDELENRDGSVMENKPEDEVNDNNKDTSKREHDGKVIVQDVPEYEAKEDDKDEIGPEGLGDFTEKKEDSASDKKVDLENSKDEERENAQDEVYDNDSNSNTVNEEAKFDEDTNAGDVLNPIQNEGNHLDKNSGEESVALEHERESSQPQNDHTKIQDDNDSSHDEVVRNADVTKEQENSDHNDSTKALVNNGISATQNNDEGNVNSSEVANDNQHDDEDENENNGEGVVDEITQEADRGVESVQFDKDENEEPQAKDDGSPKEIDDEERTMKDEGRKVNDKGSDNESENVEIKDTDDTQATDVETVVTDEQTEEMKITKDKEVAEEEATSTEDTKIAEAAEDEEETSVTENAKTTEQGNDEEAGEEKTKVTADAETAEATEDEDKTGKETGVTEDEKIAELAKDEETAEDGTKVTVDSETTEATEDEDATGEEARVTEDAKEIEPEKDEEAGEKETRVTDAKGEENNEITAKNEQTIGDEETLEEDTTTTKEKLIPEDAGTTEREKATEEEKEKIEEEQDDHDMTAKDVVSNDNNDDDRQKSPEEEEKEITSPDNQEQNEEDDPEKSIGDQKGNDLDEAELSGNKYEDSGPNEQEVDRENMVEGSDIVTKETEVTNKENGPKEDEGNTENATNDDEAQQDGPDDVITADTETKADSVEDLDKNEPPTETFNDHNPIPDVKNDDLLFDKDESDSKDTLSEDKKTQINDNSGNDGEAKEIDQKDDLNETCSSDNVSKEIEDKANPTEQGSDDIEQQTPENNEIEEKVQGNSVEENSTEDNKIDTETEPKEKEDNTDNILDDNENNMKDTIGEVEKNEKNKTDRKITPGDSDESDDLDGTGRISKSLQSEDEKFSPENENLDDSSREKEDKNTDEDEGDDDKKNDPKETEIIANDESPADTKHEWTLTTVTGNEQDKKYDGQVAMTIYGQKGKSERLFLTTEDSDCYTTGKTDIFKVNVPHLGLIYKILLRLENDSEDIWHLDKVSLQNKEIKDENYEWEVGKSLSSQLDTHDDVVELPIKSMEMDPLPVFQYHVTFYTGNQDSSYEKSLIYTCLYGQLGDTGNRRLKASLNNDHKFCREQADTFVFSAVYLGKITKVLIGHDGTASAWALTKLEIRESKDAESAYVFNCTRPLENTDGSLETELVFLEIEGPEPKLLNEGKAYI